MVRLNLLSIENIFVTLVVRKMIIQILASVEYTAEKIQVNYYTAI